MSTSSQLPDPATEFSDRVVLVTGSSSGIGERIAQRFAALGATVVVNSSSSVEAGEAVAAALRADFGATASYVRSDISDPEQAHALIDEVVATHGKLDVLVNNAGWTTRINHRDLDALTDEVFRKTFEVNVFGTWWVTKAAMPHLKAVEDGNVVTITSVAGVRPIGSSMAYSMSKAALNQMTVLLAKSYGPVRVNAVAPGLVATPWTSEWDDQHQAIALMNPIGRSATPDDVAEATLALVRNRYVTGEVFVVDGGLTQIQ
ncbi:MAG TPA: SDR family oxidoreductase [Ilumatobacter sp.]|nr:SDR family oxidoreductase [Ilumatobacter sp.]